MGTWTIYSMKRGSAAIVWILQIQFSIHIPKDRPLCLYRTKKHKTQEMVPYNYTLSVCALCTDYYDTINCLYKGFSDCEDKQRQCKIILQYRGKRCLQLDTPSFQTIHAQEQLWCKTIRIRCSIVMLSCFDGKHTWQKEQKKLPLSQIKTIGCFASSCNVYYKGFTSIVLGSSMWGELKACVRSHKFLFLVRMNNREQ